jgi:pimeloyl-ACP methyl ester carboxylesterase
VEITPSSSGPVLPKKLPKAALDYALPLPALSRRPIPDLPVTSRLVLRHLQKAELARSSYRDAQSLKDEYHANSFCEFGSLNQKQFAGFGILDADGCAVIAFRGTVISSWHNWATDFDMGFVENPARHQGFQRAWQAVAPEVHAWLALHHPRQITLTGHSLGGAMAIIAAFYLSNAWSINEVVTFGCPRVGSDDFVNAYSNARSASDDPTVGLGAVTTRYVKSSDVVARVPWESFGYNHVGRCLYFNRHGEQTTPPGSLLERVYFQSDMQERVRPKYGVLGRLNIDLTPQTTRSPAHFYGAIDLMSRVLPGWLALVSVIGVGLLVDLLRHPMDGYIDLLQLRLIRTGA